MSERALGEKVGRGFRAQLFSFLSEGLTDDHVDSGDELQLVKLRPEDNVEEGREDDQAEDDPAASRRGACRREQDKSGSA